LLCICFFWLSYFPYNQQLLAVSLPCDWFNISYKSFTVCPQYKSVLHRVCFDFK
jgi:hypothetical protein